MPESVHESPAEAWVGGGLLQGWGHWVQQCLHGTFWRRSPLFSLPPPEFGLRSNNREGAQTFPSIENWIKGLLSMAPPIRTWPSYPSVSLSHQVASISLFSFSIRGRHTENHNHRKLTNLITWTTALSNSVNLWAVLCRATQMDRYWWRVLTKYGPLEREWQTASVSLPWESMNSIKRQKDRTLKDHLTGW